MYLTQFRILTGSAPARLLGLTILEWFPLAAVSVVAGSCVGAFFFEGEVEPWTIAAVALSCLILGHMCLNASRYVALPGLISVVASIELLLSPVIAEKFPPSLPTFEPALSLAAYLRYAIPATALLWIGVHLPVSRIAARGELPHAASPLTKRQRLALDCTLIGGLLLSSNPFPVPAGLAFLVLIIASFRFFAAFAYMMTGSPGWRLRLWIVILHLVVAATTEGVFYQVIQWGGCFVVMYAFRKRWKLRIAGIVLVSIVGGATLQYVKADYRKYLEQVGEDVPIADRVHKLGELVWDKVANPQDQMQHIYFGDLMVRFNQGWIITKIMDRVPQTEPYANGSTISEGIEFAILPRMLFPNKKAGASRELFYRFTGLQLGEWTSMGLSIPGEMYANFGYAGGLAGTFAMGLLIGFGYSIFGSLARRTPVWWAMAPVALLATTEPAWNFEDILNYVVKVSLVVFFASHYIPWMRDLLQTRKLSLELSARHRRVDQNAAIIRAAAIREAMTSERRLD